MQFEQDRDLDTGLSQRKELILMKEGRVEVGKENEYM